MKEFNDFKFDKTILKNEMNIYSITKECETIQINIGIKTGSIYENDKTNGFSHYCEHMLFKGTIKNNSNKLLNKIINLGENLSAYTNYSEVVLYGTFLKNDLDLAIDTMSDMIINSNFNNDEFVKEKGVILSEIKKNLDDKYEQSLKNHYKFIYGEYSNKYNILGDYEHINNCLRDDVYNYYKKVFVPSNTIITVISPYKHEDIVSVINKYFCNWENINQNRNLIIPKPKCSDKPEIFNIKGEQTNIILSFNYDNFSDKEIFAIHLATSILGDGYNSFLWKILREKYGLCYEVDAFIGNELCENNLYIFVSVEHHKYAKTLKAIDEAIGDMFLVENFEIIRNIYKKKIMLYLLQLSKREDFISKIYIESFTRSEDIRNFEKYLEFLDNVKFDFFLRTLDKLFRNKAISINK